MSSGDDASSSSVSSCGGGAGLETNVVHGVPVCYEYLDHTADVQLHGWGYDLGEALENTTLALFDYMSEVKRVEQVEERVVRVSGHDLQSLVFNILDQWLYLFATEGFIPSSVFVAALDTESMTAQIKGVGEIFDSAKHSAGTEVKAITFSNMQIIEDDDKGRADVYVIVDI